MVNPPFQDRAHAVAAQATALGGDPDIVLVKGVGAHGNPEVARRRNGDRRDDGLGPQVVAATLPRLSASA